MSGPGKTMGPQTEKPWRLGEVLRYGMDSASSPRSFEKAHDHAPEDHDDEPQHDQRR